MQLHVAPELENAQIIGQCKPLELKASGMHAAPPKYPQTRAQVNMHKKSAAHRGPALDPLPAPAPPSGVPPPLLS